ncbi:hypothetical protein D3C72_1270640 [compost metagenome]
MPDASTFAITATCRMKHPYPAPLHAATDGEVGAVHFAAATFAPDDTAPEAIAQRATLGETPYVNFVMTVLDPARFAEFAPGQAYELTLRPKAQA